MSGIPVVYNPILFIPFLMTPIVLTSISYFAMYIGLIPLAVHQVEWTTPIILSGYVSTGSFAGSLLQLFNLAVGVLIYLPFIKIAQNRYFRNLKYNVDRLTAAVIENEQTGVNYSLLARNDKLSSTAKTLASDLKNAVKRGQIMVYYQPQINYDGEIAGIEALLRWKHDIVGFVYPPLVIRLAEETGIMNELGHMIAETSIKELNIIDKICGNNIKLSINISPGQLNDKEFFNDIKSLLDKYNVGRNRLGLELTEQTALTCSPVILDRIDKIHDMGVFIIMDDFGMGHSSLMYLQNNHFDVVKLDGSLVRDMLTNDRSCDIISSIVYLSKSLNFRIIAEYVETEEQKNKLKELGCYIYQGYLYSPAVPADELERYVSNGGCKG